MCPAIAALRASIPTTANPRTRKLAFKLAEPKTRQVELFRPRYNVEPGQHSGRLLDVLRFHATPVVVLVEALQTAMSKPADHRDRI